MDSRQAILATLEMADFIAKGYLSDLTEAELMARPVPGANHIAWQLGHLINSERDMVEAVCPGTMAPLPAGFKEAHSKETASSDDPSKFLRKDDYLKLHDTVRAGTTKALNSLTDAQFDQPAPESMRSYASTVGHVFTLQGQHWTMHSGQWAVTRRKLGRPPQF